MKRLLIAASTALITLPVGQAMAADSQTSNRAPASVNADTNTGKALMALRSTIVGLTNESVDYSTMTPDLAAKIREQNEQITPLLRQFGPLQTAQAKGTENGAEKFRVVFANQATDWLIGFDDKGKIALLLFRPAQD